MAQAVTPFKAARAEASGKGPTFEFAGERFAAVDPGAMALVEWAAASDLDTESASPAEVAAANGAIFHYLQAVVADDDWRRFRALARSSRATADQLLEAIRNATAAIAGRPTEPPSDSAASPSTNGRPSTDASFSPAASSSSA